jgi:hypothetical protein
MITCTIKCSSLATLKTGSFTPQWNSQENKKRSSRFFSRCQRSINRSADTHKTLSDDHSPLACFFKQCQNADCASSILNQLKLKKDRKQKTLKKLNIIKTMVCINGIINTSRDTMMDITLTSTIATIVVITTVATIATTAMIVMITTGITIATSSHISTDTVVTMIVTIQA